MNLPIGIQSFRKIREGNYYYVDKTYLIDKLKDGGYYFLSRPRRFGKSLFLDTLKEAFSGNKELFKDLAIYNEWNWSVKYPIIKIDFSLALSKNESLLEKSLLYFINSIAKEYEINLTETLYNLRFEELIHSLFKKYNQKVVILIDEYDKPILDVIEDKIQARKNRDLLKKFFEVLKPNDSFIHLAFITGVSRFSKVSIFSGLNQLNDITLDSKFATICGYTESDLREVFWDRVSEFDMDEIRLWYNGYSWLGERVYNPFDILLLFDKKRFLPYWFETGTPTFLIKLLKEQKYYLPQIENLEVGEEILSNLDIDFIYPENILFQAGYLTIKKSIQRGKKIKYLLDYPNLEVRMSFNDSFLLYLFNNIMLKERVESNLISVFEKDDLDKMKEVLYTFFASIPSDWYRRNDISGYEGFYASVVYALFNGAGLNVIAEDNTSVGRIDLSIIQDDRVYIVEFKIIDNKRGSALEQIRKKRYYKKYQGRFSKIYLVGIEFSKEERNIVNFEWEKIE